MSVFHDYNLALINTMTKYPSIQTYHKMHGQEAGKLAGSLKEETNFDLSGKKLFGSEKVDGTNTRIIVGWDGFIVGSREELLWHSEDLLHAESSYIVETMKEFLNCKVNEDLQDELESLSAEFAVVYGETYGHRVNGGKNYTTEGKRGFRMFDVAIYTHDMIRELETLPLDRVSAWRENDTTRFVPVSRMASVANMFISDVGDTLVPPVALGEIPTSIQETNDWLHRVIPETKVALSEGALKKPEGTVVRTEDRSIICKIRFEDYNRAIRLSTNTKG